MAKEKTPEQNEDKRVTELEGLVASLQKTVNGLSSGKVSGATIRNRTKEHVASVREFEKDGEVKGIVTRLYSVKEVKDKTENKRFIGLCKLDVLNPETGKSATYEDVDYLDFLNNARRVAVKVASWTKEVRYETDPRKGGGGRGPLKRISGENEVIIDPDHEFEVGYTDHTFTLLIQDGAFEGKSLVSDGKALNI